MLGFEPMFFKHNSQKPELVGMPYHHYIYQVPVEQQYFLNNPSLECSGIWRNTLRRQLLYKYIIVPAGQQGLLNNLSQEW